MITPRPYQVSGAEWMAPKTHALLLDETRVGKTYTALLAYAQAGGEKLAVLGPAIARGVWRAGFADMGSPGELWVDSYDRIATNDRRRADLMRFRPDVLVLDEAHRLRTPTARRTRAVYGPKCEGNGLDSYAGAVWRLSGTLAPKHIGETWTHLRAIGQTDRGYHSFLHRYCTGYEGPYGWKPTGVREEHVEEFKALLRPISLRRRRSDIWQDLPPVAWNTVPLEVTPHVRSQIDTAAREAKLERVADLSQIDSVELGATHLHSLLSKIKLPLVIEQAEEMLEAGVPKLVIFGWHKPMLEGLRDALRPYGAEMIYGGTTENARWKRMERFQTDPMCRVIIGQIRTMGESVALHAARHVLFAEYTWSLGDVLQAVTRVFRPERKEPMEVMVASLAGTVDDAIASLLVREAAQHEVLNSLSNSTQQGV